LFSENPLQKHEINPQFTPQSCYRGKEKNNSSIVSIPQRCAAAAPAPLPSAVSGPQAWPTVLATDTVVDADAVNA
jgi:hypothetical protein